MDSHRIGLTTTGTFIISTAYLSLDCRYETMVFTVEAWNSGRGIGTLDHDLYGSRADACNGHTAMVSKWEAKEQTCG